MPGGSGGGSWGGSSTPKKKKKGKYTTSTVTSRSPAPGWGGSVGAGGGGGGGGSQAVGGPAVKSNGSWKNGTGKKGGGQGFKDLLNLPANLLNPVIEASEAGAENIASSGGGGGGRRRGGGGGGGGGGYAVEAAPEIPAFQDPFAQLRETLKGAYLGNGADNQGIQAYLQKIAADAAARTQGYSADAANQAKAAGAAITGNLQQSEAARKAAIAAQMNDLIGVGGQAQSGGLQAIDAEGQANAAGEASRAGQLTGRMAEIFGQQSADRLAGIQNTGQYAQGQAAANYSKMLGQVDMQTAAAKQQYDQMVAGLMSGGGGGGGGRGGGGRGGGGSGSGGGGLGTYQDTDTRTLTDNQTTTLNDEDMAAMAQADVWNGLTASDKAAVQAIQTYAVFPELAQAQGVDLKKISQSNPNAFNYWMQVQGNEFGYPYQKSTSTNTQQQYNRDSRVQTSKYTSPKVKGAAPTHTAGGKKLIKSFF
jgi:hypothetical protein